MIRAPPTPCRCQGAPFERRRRSPRAPLAPGQKFPQFWVLILVGRLGWELPTFWTLLKRRLEKLRKHEMEQIWSRWNLWGVYCDMCGLFIWNSSWARKVQLGKPTIGKWVAWHKPFLPQWLHEMPVFTALADIGCEWIYVLILLMSENGKFPADWKTRIGQQLSLETGCWWFLNIGPCLMLMLIGQSIGCTPGTCCSKWWCSILGICLRLVSHWPQKKKHSWPRFFTWIEVSRGAPVLSKCHWDGDSPNSNSKLWGLAAPPPPLRFFHILPLFPPYW